MPKPQTPTVAVERGSGNVFADIGLPDAETHLVKASLVSRIDDIIRRRKLTQVKAAAVMGLKQPDVSRLLSGDFRDFSVERLLRLLLALDRDIDIVIRRKPARARRPGRLQIVAVA
jgi:predicted XRE-type DNA-binding protein